LFTSIIYQYIYSNKMCRMFNFNFWIYP
jgi:hypothetical protein